MLRAGHKAPGSPSQMYKLGYQEFTSPCKALPSEAFVTETRSPNGDVCLGINDSASGERRLVAGAQRPN